MTDKQLVIDTLKKLPEEASIEQILEEIEIFVAIRRGEQAANAGQVIPHEDVKKMVATIPGQDARIKLFSSLSINLYL